MTAGNGRENLLLAAIVAGVAAGIGFGVAEPHAAARIAWVGDVFLDILKMLVLPLIFCSMVAAVTGIVGAGSFRRMALMTFGYYLVTTLAAVLVGLVVVGVVAPGVGVTLEGLDAPSIPTPGGIDTIRQTLVTPNLFEAAVEYKLLPLLVFALLFGAALGSVGDEGRVVIRFFHGCNAALLALVGWVMWLAPVGIAALLASRVGAAGGLEGFVGEAKAIAAYCTAVLLGLALHAGITLPTILAVFARRNPVRYAWQMLGALATAFATASSSATLAVTLRLAEERAEVRSEAASFVLPLGATVNMDGTALYEAVAAIFIAQAAGIELGVAEQAIIALTATLASIGAAGIPQAGLVTMVIVLEAVGLPLEGIALLLAVDWLLDRFRTAVNVWGDAIGAAVIGARLPV